LRPILMTSCAMIAGMLPMAIGLSAGGDQTAPLGRAVVGGLAASLRFASGFVSSGRSPANDGRFRLRRRAI
jgi:multidrug efflux pump subunit AcrB